MWAYLPFVSRILYHTADRYWTVLCTLPTDLTQLRAEALRQINYAKLVQVRRHDDELQSSRTKGLRYNVSYLSASSERDSTIFVPPAPGFVRVMAPQVKL